MHVDKIVGRLVTSERHLADALVLVSDRHSRDAEIRDVARTIAAWSAEHVDALDEVVARYGTKVTKQPDQLRSALFHDPRVGGIGLVEDLHDLALLAHEVELLWIELGQAARALFDHELAKTCTNACEHTKRQLAWLLTQIKAASPQAIAVPAEAAREIEASVPRTVSAPTLPDVIWAPLVATALLALVGICSVVAGQPWLLPSLGPSAYLAAVDWAHPSARAYNTIVGHLIGLGAGFAMVVALGVYDEPGPITTGSMTIIRVAAAALSVGITIAVALSLKADHPPAGATALLVTLGAIETMPQAVGVVVGACLLALAAVFVRAIRSGRFRRKQEMTRPRRLEPQLRPS